MVAVDLSGPLLDLSVDQPAGPNLEFDPDFIELDRLAQGKPEQQYGSTIVPAEEPDWKAVEAAAIALTERTYDLRVLSHLAVARLHRTGIMGYAAVLDVIRHMVEDRWDSVHPQLDPEDDDDPTLRANALLSLCHQTRVLRILRTMPLARSERGGSVSWRDIGVANGSIEVPEDTPKLTDAVIAAAFRESDPVALGQLRATLETVVACSTAIPNAFDVNAGLGTGPDLTDLGKLVRDIAAIMVSHQSAQPPVFDAAGEETAAETTMDAALSTTGPATAAPRSAPVFTIATMSAPTNRADALRLLDLVIEFYQRYEPSSPLPLLIARARRLAELGFMDILRDMAPEGLNQAEQIAGTVDK